MKYLNRKIVLVSVLFLVLLGGLFLVIRQLQEQQDPRSRAAGEAVSFAITPVTQNAVIGSDATFQIVLQAGTNNITGVDVTFIYDTALVNPAVWGAVPEVYFSDIIYKGVVNPTAGTVRFTAINTQPTEIKGNVLLGRINLNTKGLGSGTLRVQKAQVTAAGIDTALPLGVNPPATFNVVSLPTSTPIPTNTPTPTPLPTNTPTPTVVPRPDLRVTDISWTPSAPVAGNQVTFKATIQNQGTAPTPNGIIHGVLFKVDGVNSNWSDGHTSSIPVGGSVTLTANGGPTGSATWLATSGTKSITAQVDDALRITESNETNNTFSESLTVVAPTNTPTPIPTNTPTPTPTRTPTPIPTNTPIPPTATNVPLIGDYNADLILDLLDFNLWKDEYIGVLSTKLSDGNNDGTVDLLDFAIWRNRFN